MDNTESVDVNAFLNLISKVRSEHNNATVQPNSKPVLAENVLYPELTKKYENLTSFAKETKGDRATIRKYLNSGSGSNLLYRKQWKLSYVMLCYVK